MIPFFIYPSKKVSLILLVLGIGVIIGIPFLIYFGCLIFPFEGRILHCGLSFKITFWNVLFWFSISLALITSGLGGYNKSFYNWLKATSKEAWWAFFITFLFTSGFFGPFIALYNYAPYGPNHSDWLVMILNIVIGIFLTGVILLINYFKSKRK